MPFIQVSQGKLFYVEKGSGEPLLFLNGLSGDHAYWMGQLRFFGRRQRCLALDNRDVGQTSHGEQLYTIRDLAADVAEFLDRLGIQETHVLGLSMGGMIAQELALGWPERVKSLTLLGTLARADQWFRSTLEAFGMVRRQVPDTAAFFEAILPWWVSYRFLEFEERVSWLRWLLHQNPYSQPLEGFTRQLQAIGKHDALDRLSAIRCPVLVLVGEDDNVAPPRYARQLKDVIPHARLEILPGVGHAPPIENPERFNFSLAEFLESQNQAFRKRA